MSYLKKDQRQYEIQQAAIQIAVSNGLAAITARRVAQQAGIAIGQVHHHFRSVGQLKATTLLAVIKQLIEESQQANNDQSFFEQIINIVSPMDGEAGLVTRRIWNEAVFLAERDTDIKQAYKSTMDDWHKATVKLIKKAHKAGEFSIKKPSATAWRLIALSCGLDAITVIEDSKISNKVIREYLCVALEQELQTN